MTDKKYYLIKSGPIKGAIDQYRASVNEFNYEMAKYCEDRGTEQYFAGGIGEKTAHGLLFERGSQPEGWTIPDSKGWSRPKKGTDDFKKGFPSSLNQQTLISDVTGMPCSLSYEYEGGSGWSSIGDLNPCQFLYFNDLECLVLVDVEAEVQERIDEGYVIKEPAKSWSLDTNGLEEISEKKWQILVLQEEVKEEEAA